MQSQFRVLIAIFILTAAILACANPLNIGTPDGPANVETMVAATFAALTASAPQTGVTPSPSTPSLLPSSMYFLNNDNVGHKQVYRLDKDGKSITQITFEPTNVDGYDVSRVDGSVVYVTNNQLLVVNTDGGNRKLLVDGGPRDENNPFLSNVNNPAWSPNGQTIAYGYQGLNLYSVTTGQSNRVLENQVETSNGFPFPRELYWPNQYSPDGSKLLINLGYYEGGDLAIYYPSGDALVRLTGASDTVCCSATWTMDGASLHTGRATIGMFGPGLWRLDAATGQVTTLLAGDPGNGTFNFADEPYLAPDGQLYYFFANLPSGDEFINRVPLQLVRSEPDGVTGRTTIRPETFNLMNEALWAPDASFVIVANAPIPDVYQGGTAELYYTNGQKSMMSLVPFAMNMKWGP